MAADEDAGEPPLCSLQGNVAWLGMTAGASRHGRRQPLLRSALPKPLPLATWPLEQRELIHECVRLRSSLPRRPSYRMAVAGDLIRSRRGTALPRL